MRDLNVIPFLNFNRFLLARWLADGPSAIDYKWRSRRERGIVAGEEQRHVGDIFGMPGAPDRLKLSQKHLGILLSAETICEHRRIDAARTDTVNANLMLPDFERDRAR